MYLKQADDPPYLSVGTAVSAKYKGAFCEAKVSKVVRVVKCKVTYKMGLGIATVSDENIKGTIRIGHTVLAKHPEKKELVEATIAKIQDCSQYTVVFDDGDITTLRRTALCLKSGRHFNESETLDQLPLTHPEHFGNPVVGGRRGRRNRQLKDDSSEGEAEEENEPDLEGYSTDIGRVVSVETSDKKRGKDNWFPGLVVIPSAQPTVRINVKDEYLIRSFKDGRYYTVPKKEVSEFSRETGEKAESSVLTEAVSKAVKYLDLNELPAHWERNSLFNMQSTDTDSEENYSDSSDDGPNEEKDRFVAQLYKFMDDSGTPLNKSPMIANKDVDLHRLFRVAHKLGGYNRVTNQNKWRSVTTRLKLPANQITFNQVKSVYKKCLFSYESFYRTLGVTMLNHTRSTKKNRGRSLIRDKDRATPVNSPKPEKDEEEKKEEEKTVLEVKKKVEAIKKEEEKKKFIENSENSSSSSDTPEPAESLPSTSREVGRPRRVEKVKEKKIIKVQTPTDKPTKQEIIKKEEEEKTQQTRSKSLGPKTKDTSVERKKEIKQVETPKIPPQKPPKKLEEEKKRGRKRLNLDEKSLQEPVPEASAGPGINIGDKLKVYYGPTHESKVTYEAKVIEIDKDASGPVYRVHYTGWNTRYDEWINPIRIAENLSASTKAKRLKQNAAGGSSSSGKGGSSKSGGAAGKRGRGMSITGRSTATEAPRSTTPSSVTSSSSRTKSPATPATRSTSRMTRQDYGRKTRRSSAQTDISNHSESDSEISESESELMRTRSGARAEEVELKTYKKKAVAKTPTKSDSKAKESDDKEDEQLETKPKRLRKLKKSPEKSADDSDEEGGTNPPKGRDFDLNQIRSELKGFSKAVKTPSIESGEKEGLSSSDDSTSTSTQIPAKLEGASSSEDKLEVKPMDLEKSPSSEDIYEFKEPEPFEFETRPKMSDDKSCKKRIPRLFEDLEKSPKRKPIKSPTKPEKTSPDLDKKFRKTTPLRKPEEFEEKEEKKEDLFDKLVESPSFNLVKAAEKAASCSESSKAKITKNLDALDLFRDFNEPVDECSRDIDLSDNDTQIGQPIFSGNDELFCDTFCKPGLSSLEVEFSTKSDENKKENDEFDSIRESITRAIQRTSSSDEYENLSDDDLLITPSLSSYAKKRDVEPSTSASSTIILKPEPPEVKLEVKEEAVKSPVLNISPALQESDSKLLQSICSASPLPTTIAAKLDETKDINLKTGTKIADSILQKFNSLKNKDSDSEEEEEEEKKELENEPESEESPQQLPLEAISKPVVELKVKPSEIECKKPLVLSANVQKSDISSELKKKRKVVSKAYIEDSDSDSSDSEQLVIVRSDEDSQTNSLLDKPEDAKESDSNLSAIQIATTDDSQEEGLQQQQQKSSTTPTRNFKFDKVEEKLSETTTITATVSTSVVAAKEQEVVEAEIKEEEPADSQLHSLLLCEETIPRSPAPVAESSGNVQEKKSNKSVLEMPFASAPGSSNNKNMLLNSDHKPVNKPQPPPLVIPAVVNQDTNAVLDNTPPTTPESSISNLSPRRDAEDLSPNTVENESCKSNDAEPEFSRKRRNSSINKPSLYSEEDSQMTNEASSVKKSCDDPAPAMCRKRRKSLRTEETPVKRGRKPLNRSRHNSDSDDTSEHSLIGQTAPAATNLLGVGYADRATKSPRPSKYNFFVEFDPSLNSGQRIAVLQQKLSELRKTYAEVKSELAAVERRRKKIRRREREALKASKQEIVCG